MLSLTFKKGKAKSQQGLNFSLTRYSFIPPVVCFVVLSMRTANIDKVLLKAMICNISSLCCLKTNLLNSINNTE